MGQGYINVGQGIHVTEHLLHSAANVYNITSFPNHQGMYFESLGQVKMTHLNWDLVIYVDLATPI